MKHLAALFILTVSLIACDKDKTQKDFGPQVDPEFIQTIQNKAMQNGDPWGLSVGEFVYNIKTQEVYSGGLSPSRTLLEEEGITVTEREDFPTYSDITIVREVIEHNTTSTDTAKFKDVYRLAAPGTSSSTAPEEEATDSPEVEDPNFSVTYHNLIVKKEKVSRPDKVNEREPCPQDKDCSINVTHLYYDIVVHEKDQPSRKNQVEIMISDEVPYFANILKNCVTSVASIEDMRPLVRQCTSVLDYQKPALTTP